MISKEVSLITKEYVNELKEVQIQLLLASSYGYFCWPPEIGLAVWKKDRHFPESLTYLIF